MTGHPEPERLTRAALPAEPDDPGLTAHLQACSRCRTELAELRRTVDLAREGRPDPLPAPPPRVWQAIAVELGLADVTTGHAAAGTNGQAPPGEAGVGDDRPGPTRPAPPPRARRPRASAPIDPPATAGPLRRGDRSRRRVALVLVAAAVGLVVGLGIGRALPPRPAPPPEPVARLTAVGDLDPAATGSVSMAAAGEERRMVVEVRDVTNIGSGDHLEAWLMDATGTRLVPLGPLDGGGGVFHGTFALPAGLPLAEFGRVDVSAERWDGNPAHSTVSLLRGSL